MIRVAISYRVLQSWRVPVFQRLSEIKGIDLCVFYADDFEGTKVKSYSGIVNFKTVKLPTKKISFKTSNGHAYIPYNPNLYKKLEEFRPNVIIVEGASNILNNLVCFFYAKRKKCKIIQWGLGELEGRKKSIHRRLADVFFHTIERQSDAAIAYSSYGAQYYKNLGLAESSVFTAVNVIDTEKRIFELKRYCNENNLRYPSPVPIQNKLVFIGSLSENKNIDLLIKSFKKALEHLPNLTLDIIGNGPFRSSLEKLVDELNLNSEISFKGNQTFLSPYLYDASLMVLPGLGGLAISDSLIHGVPVLCGIGDGCEKDLVTNNGVILKNITLDSLCTEIVSIFSSPERLENLRKNAQKFERSNFNINNYVSVIHQAITYVLD